MKTKEEVLDSKPSISLGLDIFYGRQTALNAIKEFSNQDKWISIEIKPEKTGVYLGYDPNAFIADKIVLLRYDKYNNNWSDGTDAFHPSFWQNLPLPPKSK